jgi:hypothetical protein
MKYAKHFAPNRQYGRQLDSCAAYGQMQACSPARRSMATNIFKKSAQISLLSLAASLASQAFASIAQHTEPYISYTVQRGDTLQRLSQQLIVDPKRWNEVARLNGLKNPNLIRPGLVLDIPKSLINFDEQPKLAHTGILQSVNGSVTINGAPASAGAIVPEGARVETGSGSSAVVKLSDGSQVQLMPRSLADVVKQHGYALKDPASSASTTWFSGAIRLVSGVLDIVADKTAKRKDPLNVLTPTALIGVRGTQFRVAFEDPTSGTARTEVLEGKVRADNPAQAAGADIGGGFGVAIKPNEREIKVVALLPALPESALPGKVERAREGAVADWAVLPLSGAAGYRAELALDPAFTQIVLDTKSSGPSINLAAAANGNYFARVRGIDPSGIEGYNAVRRIDIATAPAPVVNLIWIKEIGIAAIADHTPEGVRLRVNTSATDTPKPLQMHIAEDPQMTQGLQSMALDAAGSIVLRQMQPGEKRYIRFSGIASSGAAASSPVMMLELPLNWGVSVFSLMSALQN